MGYAENDQTQIEDMLLAHYDAAILFHCACVPTNHVQCRIYIVEYFWSVV